MKTVGVLALQGGFREHIDILKRLGQNAVEVRKAEQLDALDGLILPGGESTTIGKLLDDFCIKELLIEKIAAGLPTWGTCAGMILLAKEIEGAEIPHLRLMDIKVRRNAYGRQLGSFMVEEIVKDVADTPIPLVFIRAPYITSLSDNVEVLHKVDGNIVAARERNMLATSFHPELTTDNKFHQYFLKMIK